MEFAGENADFPQEETQQRIWAIRFGIGGSFSAAGIQFLNDIVPIVEVVRGRCPLPLKSLNLPSRNHGTLPTEIYTRDDS